MLFLVNLWRSALERLENLLCHGPLPRILDGSASRLVVVGIVAWRAKGDSLDESATDGAVELGPDAIGRPAIVAWEAATASVCGAGAIDEKC